MGIEIQDVKSEARELLKWGTPDSVFSLWEGVIEYQIITEWLIKINKSVDQNISIY